MEDVRGKVAVITGGASGIGRGMANAFSDAGMKVVIADVRQDGIDIAVDELTKAGHEAIGVKVDVSKLAEVEALADATMDHFGAVHVLCNNAGVGTFASQFVTDLGSMCSSNQIGDFQLPERLM